jgi:hypothetical protein
MFLNYISKWANIFFREIEVYIKTSKSVMERKMIWSFLIKKIILHNSTKSHENYISKGEHKNGSIQILIKLCKR